MYHSITIIPSDGEVPEVYLSGNDKSIPVVELGGLTIQLPGRMTTEACAAWFRALAKKAADMAEILDALDAPRVAREQREEVAS